MNGWKEIKINDLGKVVTGNTPLTSNADNFGGPYPFIKPTDMEIDRRRVSDWEQNYSEKAFLRFKNAYIPPGATGVVTIGTVGEKIFQADQWCFTNQSVNVVIPDTSRYDNDFVYYLLKHNLPKVENANPGTASGRHHVSKSNFCSIRINVPSLSMQTQIGSMLSTYDDLIENNLKRIMLLEELAQRTYGEWFVNFRVNGEDLAINRETGLLEGWERKRIGEVCSVSGGGTPSRAILEYWKDGNLSWFSPTDLSRSKSLFQTGSLEKINSLGLQKSSAKKLDANSFMMTSRATIGLFGLVDNFFCTNQGFINVTPHSSSHKEFLLFNFMSRVKEFKSYATGTTFLELSKSKFKTLEITWPTEPELARFHEILNPILELVANLTTENQHLKTSRDILLPRLMNGTINVEKTEERIALAAEPLEVYNKQS